LLGGADFRIQNSEDYARAREWGLERRLSTACAKLNALTPAPGRGKRQIREEEQLARAAQAILSAHGVEELVAYSFQRREEIEIRYVGRGRGGIERPRRTVSKVRYEITSVERREEAIAALKKTLGWRAYATDCGVGELSLEEAVHAYRNEWLVERGFNRLKGAPLSLDPVFVKRDDQIAGLINLLGIVLRLPTLIEFKVRRGLREAGDELVRLHPENPGKGTAKPTAEKILKAFSNLTLTIVHFPDRVLHHRTPLSALQARILDLLELSPDIYQPDAYKIVCRTFCTLPFPELSCTLTGKTRPCLKFRIAALSDQSADYPMPRRKALVVAGAASISNSPSFLVIILWPL
jgi:hypothetical protein